tara:strand:+ start:180 stop:809 length:630 start_codon:yes stop_codon:yes gene_type:complete
MTENNIRIYDNAMSPEDCKKIIELFETSKDQIQAFNTGRKEYSEIDIDKFETPWSETKEKFISMMKTHMNKFMKDVKIQINDFPPIIDMENIRIKKYLPNDKDEFKTHVDVLRALIAKRFLVYILYLNDVEEGGETHLPKLNIKVKPKEGRLLMFPPFWTHPHAGLKPIKGTKYVIMSYLHYGDTVNYKIKNETGKVVNTENFGLKPWQ